MRAGDLILVSHVGEPLVSESIRRVQRRAGFDDWHAQWHHAAVYVGYQQVCEAQLTGVRVDSIFKYTAGKYRLRFRRNPKLSELHGCKIALDAALKLNYRYSFLSVLQLLWQARGGWRGDRPRVLSARATICSQLYADAYGVVANETLDPAANLGITPAHLSVSKLLEDIPMQWMALRGASNANDAA
ncbi:hypothetical protein [Methylibium petroleiphilum]|uniref:hypothetical protein n=1 Tax=Methylibium petroleiphilum TaxID=105560 RepID=UPI0005A4F964|nr:hypothetical protein [Methylibium petroleiphilum]